MNVLGLEPHHVKYKEIDGIDEVISITRSEHKRLTWEKRRLVKAGLAKCIPKNVQLNAHMRLIQKIEFSSTFGQNTTFHEQILYEPYSGKVHYCARFRLNKGKSDVTCLPVVDLCD